MWQTKDAEPVAIEAVSLDDVLSLADTLGALWLQIGDKIIGKTIAGTWAAVW